MNKPGRRHGNYVQATRILRLLDHLRARHYGVALADLAVEFHVTERQMRRDLAALADAGNSIETTPGTDGRTRVRLESAPARSLLLTIRERYGLLAVRRVFDVLAGTPFQEDVRSIYSKVAASLPEEQRAELETFGERFLYLPDGGTKPYRDKDEVIDALLTGVIRRWRVRCRYRPATRPTHTMFFEPWAMVLYKNGLYVIGPGSSTDGDLGQNRQPFVFSVDRFVSAKYLRSERFKVPDDFRIEPFFQGAFGIFLGKNTEHVVIDFQREARSLVEERTWHPTQKIQPIDGGGVRLSFDVANLAQVRPWILGWGPLANVREPRTLRDDVARTLREAASAYEKSTARKV